MGIGNSTARRCNQVHLDTRLFGVVSMTINPVSIHLTDFNGRDSRVMTHVVDLHIGVEGDQLFV